MANIREHRLSTRIWHWLTALSVLLLLMSGLTIFNAHPRLYWGEAGNRGDPSWLAIGASEDYGWTRIGSRYFLTTGVLGKAKGQNGEIRQRAFPWWATIPSYYSLADGRRWHFFFALMLFFSLGGFLLVSLFNGHIRNNLWPRLRDLSPRQWGRSLAEHLHLSRAKRTSENDLKIGYNPLQKFSYFLVIFVVLPLVILTGMAMSPGLNAAFPLLSEILGGRQSARSIHFLCAFFLFAFFLAHMIMLLLNHPLRLLRAMITGRSG